MKWEFQKARKQSRRRDLTLAEIFCIDFEKADFKFPGSLLENCYIININEFSKTEKEGHNHELGNKR